MGARGAVSGTVPDRHLPLQGQPPPQCAVAGGGGVCPLAPALRETGHLPKFAQGPPGRGSRPLAAPAHAGVIPAPATCWGVGPQVTQAESDFHSAGGFALANFFFLLSEPEAEGEHLESTGSIIQCP